MTRPGMMAEGVYLPANVAPAATPEPRVMGAPPSTETDAGDPHDRSNPGPTGWLDDPLIWLIGLLGLATGMLGVRFRWWGSGAEVGARVDVGDEIATLIGTTLYAITGIVLFKIIASKVEIRALQELAAAV